MPDGRIWMAENCQAVQGSATFYNTDEATYGRNGKNYGRLYSWYDTVALANRVDGWHLPSRDEFYSLRNVVEDTSELKSSSYWRDATSKDPYGFSLLPAGYRDTSARFTAETETSRIWMYDATDTSSEKSFTGVNYNTGLWTSRAPYYSCCSVRLIKDA